MLCILGSLNILMMHFLDSICVKMHDFCINAIPGTYLTFPDLSLFSTKTLVETNADHQVEVRTQVSGV